MLFIKKIKRPTSRRGETRLGYVRGSIGDQKKVKTKEVFIITTSLQFAWHSVSLFASSLVIYDML